MNRYEDVTTEDLARRFADADAALRFAALHGAPIPEEAAEALLAMQDALRARQSSGGGNASMCEARS